MPKPKHPRPRITAAELAKLRSDARKLKRLRALALRWQTVLRTKGEGALYQEWMDELGASK